ncbi:Fc.00g083320.m01.CDS01 [Cosmosporella sp. VM-42]
MATLLKRRRIFDVLSNIGVLEGNDAVTAKPASYGSTHIVPDIGNEHLRLIGALPGSEIELTKGVEPLPRYQPSLFWKAMGFTLSSYLSNATSLVDEDQALFLGSQDQAGVPAGRAYPDEVTNYQTFVKADVIQKLNHPTYSTSGDSYFEYLALYMRSVVNKTDNPELAKARDALMNAKVKKDQAWEQARERYARASKEPNNALMPSFIDFLKQDVGYEAAWKHELECEKEYSRLQGESMVAVSLQLDQIKYADDRLTERVNNNMRCIALSEDFIYNPEVQAGGSLTVDPKDTYYRPFYNLPNLDLVCNTWQYMNTDETTVDRVGPIPISLLDAADRSWSDLGHPGLDKAKAPTLTDAERDLLKSLQVSITFVGAPAVISVNRGFWDEPNIRAKLSTVAKTLPPVVARPFCKTIKMMFAWGIEISIRLPVSVNDLSSKNVSLGFLKIPMAPVKDSPNEMRFTAGCNTYPLLLATLATVV